MRFLVALLILAAPAAWAQRQINTWQELGGYVGEQTAKLNELNAKLRFQQGLIDEQKAAIEAQRDFIRVQRDWIADLGCKYNGLVQALAAGQSTSWNRVTPAGTPPIAYQADPATRTRCGQPDKPAPLLPEAP
jgi:lysozyme family protein